jgi:hypothetical protein
LTRTIARVTVDDYVARYQHSRTKRNPKKSNAKTKKAKR